MSIVTNRCATGYPGGNNSTPGATFVSAPRQFNALLVTDRHECKIAALLFWSVPRHLFSISLSICRDFSMVYLSLSFSISKWPVQAMASELEMAGSFRFRDKLPLAHKMLLPAPDDWIITLSCVF